MSVKETFDGILYGGDVSLPSYWNYGRYIMDTFKGFGDKVALIDGISGESITFSEMVQEVMNFAGALRKIGVKKGDVVAIYSENRIEFLITCYATIYIGAVANFINKAYSVDELVHTLSISRPQFIFVSPDTYKSCGKILKQLRFMRIFMFGKTDGRNDGKQKDLVTRFQELVRTKVDINSVKPETINDGSETAIITYSSGTTGLPKGVKWTHGGLIIAAKQPICTDRDLKYLIVSPWTNTMGYILSNDLLTKSKTLVFLPKYNERLYLETIEKYKVNFIISVPPLIVLLSKSKILDEYDLSSVKCVYSGGATLKAEVMVTLQKRLPKLEHILQSYGSSEATGAITQASTTENKIGSVGKVVFGVYLKVVDIKTRKVLGPNKRGEVCIKGDMMFGGYVKNNNNEDYDEQGFYKTGDVAYYDEDGYLFIVDRVKEIIKHKGYQVSPTELEAVLLQHEHVKDAGIIGIPDEVAGELPLAFVVKQPGAKVSEKQLIDFVAKKVSPWKHLRGGVRFIEDIPKNVTGKILRRKLQQLVKPASKL